MKKKYHGNEGYKIDFLRGAVGEWKGEGRVTSQFLLPKFSFFKTEWMNCKMGAQD